MSPTLVLIVFIALRLLSVFYVQTFFVPDEYWQSLEVAHKFVFGYGHLTWEWKEGIRSYVYPMIFAGFYKVLALLEMDSVQLITLGPRVFQALLSAYADYRFYKWTNQRKWAIFLVASSYFLFYIGSRTLVNTLEASLTTIALSMFPWNGESSSFLWITSLLCFIRPTAAITWLPLCFYHIKKTAFPLWKILLQYLIIGFVTFAFCVGLDSWAYGKFIITPWQFFEHNVINDIGSYYGVHSWHWYFSIGLPAILGVTSIPFIFAVVNTIKSPSSYPTRVWLLISIIFTLTVLSVISHKEFRFILLLLPMCLYICTDYLRRWSMSASQLSIWLMTALVFAGNVFPIVYLSTTHQRGTLEVMPKLENIARNYRDNDGSNARFLFLLPCHSTPFYSHIHTNITMDFVRCDPDMEKDYEIFQKTPDLWVRRHVPEFPRKGVPTHVILFDDIKEKVKIFLRKYSPIFSISHTDYKSQTNTEKTIHVYELNPEDNSHFTNHPVDDEHQPIEEDEILHSEL